MGWLFAFIFFLLSALAFVFLLVGSQEKNSLKRQLRVAEERSTVLENELAVKVALQEERDKLSAAYSLLRKRMQGVVDADAERAKVLAEAKQLAETFNRQIMEVKARHSERKQAMDAEIKRLESILLVIRTEHVALSEEAALAEMGYYRSNFNFSTSQRYKKAIDDNYSKQKAILISKMAATCTREWSINGDVKLGQRETERHLSLMLRAFNGECDSAIAKVKATNFQAMESRIRKSFKAINKLGEIRSCLISEAYLDLRLEELRLEYEHVLKLQAEREEQRAIKEEMRQQAIAERELEKATQQAEREERQYEAALAKAKQEFERASTAKQVEMHARIAELEQLVAEAHVNKERALSRAQQTRSGHVYVISNVGSFGNNVYKIGMTRRLDPMERVWELSDASVPFDFDVHAIIYADDAPSLEMELHQRFADRRVNVVNQRKEFFHVTIEEIVSVVRDRCGDIELTLVAEAVEFLQSEAYRRENGRPLLANREYGLVPAEPHALSYGATY